MSHADMLTLVGTLFGAFSVGWTVGYTFLFFKQLSEKI